MTTIVQPSDAVVYPESDGEPMADNTRQFEWIVTIEQNLERQFASVPDVFVAGNLLWYPVEGELKIRQAPDVLVVFGRPKGHRGSYLQWLEAGIPPHVVFEVLSPGNTVVEMTRKQVFYDRHGVEEYYVIDPDHAEATGWLRQEGRLTPPEALDGWTSPRLGIRFEAAGGVVRLFRADGRPFESFVELGARADAEAQRADSAERRAVAEAQRAEAEAQRAEAEAQRAARFADALRARGIDPDQM